MSNDTHTLIWLFPIAFICHDFEELILGEPWLRKNADEINARLKNRIPPFLSKQIGTVLEKTTRELTLTVSLIFGMTLLSALLAAEYGVYSIFLLASGSFFLHGFMHVGQAILLRRYVPAVVTSVVVVIPYGLILYSQLTKEGMIDLSGLPLYFLLAIVLTGPFILVMHIVGNIAYTRLVRLLIG
jgi:hypothetical protein